MAGREERTKIKRRNCKEGKKRVFFLSDRRTLKKQNREREKREETCTERKKEGIKRKRKPPNRQKKLTFSKGETRGAENIKSSIGSTALGSKEKKQSGRKKS